MCVFVQNKKRNAFPEEYPHSSFSAHSRAYLLPQCLGFRLVFLPTTVALQYLVSDMSPENEGTPETQASWISPCRNKRSICPLSGSTPAHSAWIHLHGDSLQCKMVQMDKGSQTLLPGSHRLNHSNRCGSLRHTHRYLQKSRLIKALGTFFMGHILFLH